MTQVAPLSRPVYVHPKADAVSFEDDTFAPRYSRRESTQFWNKLSVGYIRPVTLQARRVVGMYHHASQKSI